MSQGMPSRAVLDHFSALRDGNAVNIPDDMKPKGYSVPPFRVSHLNENGQGRESASTAT